jgi:hypothetical protein
VAKIPNLETLSKGRHFERKIIVLCVRWYLRYKLSYRDLVEIMADVGSAGAVHAVPGTRLRRIRHDAGNMGDQAESLLQLRQHQL